MQQEGWYWKFSSYDEEKDPIFATCDLCGEKLRYGSYKDENFQRIQVL